MPRLNPVIVAAKLAAAFGQLGSSCHRVKPLDFGQRAGSVPPACVPSDPYASIQAQKQISLLKTHTPILDA